MLVTPEQKNQLSKHIHEFIDNIDSYDGETSETAKYGGVQFEIEIDADKYRVDIYINLGSNYETIESEYYTPPYGDYFKIDYKADYEGLTEGVDALMDYLDAVVLGEFGIFTKLHNF